MTTFTKLRDGNWGIRVEGEAAPAPGARVTVTKRNGRSSTVTVATVLPAVNGVTVCTIEQAAPRRRSFARSGGGFRNECEDAPCCGCCGPVPGYGGSWD